MVGLGRLSANDARILDILQRDARRPYAELGAEVGMSGPSAVGLGILAFSWITQAPGTAATDLTDEFAAIAEIEECHHIAGEADYLLKVRARDTRDLERVLRLIQATRHVFTTETDVVFSSGFERRPLNLRTETDEPGGA